MNCGRRTTVQSKNHYRKNALHFLRWSRRNFTFPKWLNITSSFLPTFWHDISSDFVLLVPLNLVEDMLKRFKYDVIYVRDRTNWTEDSFIFLTAATKYGSKTEAIISKSAHTAVLSIYWYKKNVPKNQQPILMKI